MIQKTANEFPPKGYRWNYDVQDDLTTLFDAAPTYKVYTVIVNQISNSKPVETILANELSGTPAYTYSSPGNYTIALANAFTQNKTTIVMGVGNSSGVIYGWEWNSKNGITIFSLNSSGTKTDNLFSNTTMEIRVYD